MVHMLKVWPKYFALLESKEKTAEIRRNDRNYQVGDVLSLSEYNPETESYTGKVITREVTDITTGMGISDGFVMLSLRA